MLRWYSSSQYPAVSTELGPTFNPEHPSGPTHSISMFLGCVLLPSLQSKALGLHLTVCSAAIANNASPRYAAIPIPCFTGSSASFSQGYPVAVPSLPWMQIGTMGQEHRKWLTQELNWATLYLQWRWYLMERGITGLPELWCVFYK